MTWNLPDRPHRGRGAISNRSGRFESLARVATDDGWAAEQEDMPSVATTVTLDASRTVIARNQSPDVPFDRSINPYRGCEHGCVYCFARPTHAYLGLSPGLDFETKLLAKTDAAELLEKELANPRYRPAPIAIGTNTDPYQPVERSLEVTRSILEVLSRTNHPVTIVTKSALIQRDVDILASMAERRLVRVMISVTTLDRKLARAMEPRAPTPGRRLGTVRALADVGVPVGVLMAPIVPALNDHEIEAVLEACADAGADTAGYVLLRLPLEIKDLFMEWLNSHFPDRAERVLSLMRETRGGGLYDATFGRRMTGTGVYASLISRRFALAAKRWHLGRRGDDLDCSTFRPPSAKAESPQLSLF